MSRAIQIEGLEERWALTADLSVANLVNNPTPNVGDAITYSVVLANSGPETATNVAIQDTLPPGVAFVSATPTQGTYDPATGLWVVGTVTTATPQTLQLQARVVSPIPQTSTATITQADQFDPNLGNNSASATETPQQADVTLAHAVSNATPHVGDTITFTVTLSNSGPNAATNVSVNDALPAGLTFVSATPTQGTYDPTTGLWTVGTVTTATPQTLQIQATVASPNAQTSTATISHADQFDPNPGNNSASAAETPAPEQADLTLAHTVSNATPNVGDTATFTLTLSDAGPNSATGIQVTDLLPAGLTFVSATPTQGTYDPTSGLWTVGSVTTATPQTLQIQARVVSPVPQTNTATISHADQLDPNSGNNSASATETPQQADLQVATSISNPTPNVGDTITHTVTLTNNGPDAATNVSVNDALPAGLSFVSATPSQGSYNPASGVWNVGTVIPGTPLTLTITATAVSPNPAAFTASISHADQFDPNTANNSDNTSTGPQTANLALGMTVSNATPNVGDTITFSLTLSDNGPNAATNVSVNDSLPPGLILVSATPSQGSYNSTTGLWTVGTVNTALPQTLQIQARVVSPAPQTSTATISHADQFDPNLGNNSASATETPQQADLRLAQSVSNATPNVGDTITFTVTLSDAGPNSATGVQVTELLPAGLSFVSATPSQGSYNSATGLWTVGTVSTTTPQTLQIQATVASPAPQTSTATITQSDQFDPNTGNNSASATETPAPQQADLRLAQSVSNATPNVGDIVTFTLTLSDTGPGSATGAQVTDLLPAGLTFISATPSQGSYNPATGVWDVGTVSTATPQTLQLQARVVGPVPQTNTATISHADQFDPNLGNNSASATETPQQADLALAQSVSNAMPNVGDTITFTLTLNNAGPGSATGVQVTELLPAGLTFVSATPSQGTYNSTTGLWTVGTVNPAVPQTLQIQARVTSPAPQTSTATISHADQFDPNPGNNSASATETPAPQQADLTLAQSVSNTKPNVGDTITFTLTLSDAGPGSATGVQVTDLLPAGLSFVSATPSQGTYNPATGVWTVGTVSTTTPQTLVIRARVATDNKMTVSASISRADQFDPNPRNNSDEIKLHPKHVNPLLR